MNLQPTYTPLPNFGVLIPAARNLTDIRKGSANLEDTEKLIREVVTSSAGQLQKLADRLKAPTLEQTAYNDWHFVKTQINYHEDDPGAEQIREPARTWADRKRGVDCDDMSIFLASLMICQGYTPAFEIVEISHAGSFGHIFATVNGISLDSVPEITKFGERSPLITNTKIMQLQKLSGINGLGCDCQIKGLSGIDAAADVVTQRLIKARTCLLNAQVNGLGEISLAPMPGGALQLPFNVLNVQPNPQNSGGATANTSAPVSLVDVVKSNGVVSVPGNNPGTKTVVVNTNNTAIQQAANDTAAELRKANFMIKLNGTPQRDILLPLMPYVIDINADGNLIWKDNVNLVAVADYLLKSEAGINGLGNILDDLKSKINQGVEDAKKIIKNAGEQAKTVIHAIDKYNPLSFGIREALLIAIRNNFPAPLGKSLRVGMMSEQEAKSRGLNMTEFAKAKKAYQTMADSFYWLGGTQKELDTAIGNNGLPANIPDMAKSITDAASNTASFLVNVVPGATTGVALDLNKLLANNGAVNIISNDSGLTPVNTFGDGVSIKGLGVVAAAAAAGAVGAVPIIAAIVDLINKVDWKNLFPPKTSTTPTTPTTPTPTTTPGTGTGYGPGEQNANNYINQTGGDLPTDPVIPGSNLPTPQKPTDGSATPDKSTTYLIIGGIVVAGAGIAVAMSGGKKRKR